MNSDDIVMFPSRGERPARLRVLSVANLMNLPARDYLVKGWISPAEISLIVGAKNSRKTFFALYLAYAVAQGRDIFGRRVKQCPVLYVIGEGEAGFAKRVKAMVEAFGECEDFHVIAQPVNLLHDGDNGGDVREIIRIAQARNCGLIVIDTVSRALAGGDENSPIDMGRLAAHVGELRQDTPAHILLVHHGSKADGTNSRGHSLLPNAADCVVQLEFTGGVDGTGTATIGFSRDDTTGTLASFRTELVELGTDADGDRITTLRVEEIATVEARAERADKLTDNEKIALRTLDQAMKACGVMATVFEDGADGLVVREADWRTWFYRNGKPGEAQETKRQAFKRVVTSLLAKQRIGTRDDFVWPTGGAL